MPDEFDVSQAPYVIRFESRPEDPNFARGMFGTATLDTRPPLDGLENKDNRYFTKLYQAIKKSGILELAVPHYSYQAIKQLQFAQTSKCVLMWSVDSKLNNGATMIYIHRSLVSGLRYTSLGGLLVTVHVKEVDFGAHRPVDLPPSP